MNPDTVIKIQAVVSIAVVIAFGIMAQYYRILSEKMAASLLASHAWIDEIITALEDKNVSQGDAVVDRLVDVRRGGGIHRDGDSHVSDLG